MQVNQNTTIFAHYKVDDMHLLYVLIRPQIHDEPAYQKIRKELLNSQGDRSKFIDLHVFHPEYFRTIVDLNVFYTEHFAFQIHAPYDTFVTQDNGSFIILDFGVET